MSKKLVDVKVVYTEDNAVEVTTFYDDATTGFGRRYGQLFGMQEPDHHDVAKATERSRLDGMSKKPRS